MPHNIATLFLLAGLITGPLLIDPVHPDAAPARSESPGLADIEARDSVDEAAESAENLATPPATGAANVIPEPELALALATPRPTEWMPRLRRCRNRGARRYCDGPRMVAKPAGAPMDLAETLDLGERRTVSHLMRKVPLEDWTAAVALDGAPADGILFPVAEGTMGRGFGFVRRAALRHRRHDGIDIPAPAGSEVRSVADGIVAYADNGVSGYGNLMMIVHRDGTTSLYAHLRAVYLFAGQRVARGQTIGEVGSTGLSGAPHLHFEYREGGTVTDPVPRFVDLPAQVATELAARAARRTAHQERRAARTRRARRARRAERSRQGQMTRRAEGSRRTTGTRGARRSSNMQPTGRAQG
ncbi:MAG: M23 family metallopeptidase [Deltaproteobacteria bacterium]|nr:M23 family metallopeptidase [Deltaproteobacteria bacterium]